MEILKIKVIYQTSNYASMKFKELEVEREHLWIMLFNSIILENLTIFCILTVPETISYFTLKQMLHGCRQFLFCNLRLISKKNETLIFCYKENLTQEITSR